jgi:DNA-binding GntR family transcriptional regulator
MTKSQHVATDLRRRITTEEFRVGDKLPGVSELARQYGCSWEVARQALWILHGQGWIGKPRQGLNTRVIARPEPAEPSPRELLAEVQEMMRDLGAKLEALATVLTN